MGATFSRTKPSAAVLDYVFDFAARLGASDTIDTAACTVTNATKDAEANDDTTATVRVSGGSNGVTAKALCHIVTTLGYEYEETLALEIADHQILNPILKAPAEVLAIPAPTWSDLNGDTISSYAWAAQTGLTIDSGGSSATVVISGGTLGSDYTLTCTITTASGQVDVRQRLVQVREK